MQILGKLETRVRTQTGSLATIKDYKVMETNFKF